MAAWRQGIIMLMRVAENDSALAPSDWLLAETTRRIDEATGEFRLDDPATAKAAASPGAPAGRIVARARRLPGADRLAEDIGQLFNAARWLTLLLMLLGLLAGIAAASGIQAGANTIALSYAVLVLLGVPLLLLLAWALLSLRRGGAEASGLPGRLMWWLMLAFSRRFGLAAKRRHLAAALGELGRLRGRTLMALATHAFWSMFFVGCIGWMWLRFLGLRFDFSWETTLLAGPWLEELIVAIGWLPSWLFGLSLPTPEQVSDVLSGHSAAGDRALWAGYLIGALGLYGLAPRALLALWFLARWRRARLPLDFSRSGYLRLLPVLSGASRGIGPRGKPPPERNPARTAGAAPPGSGQAVLVGVELDCDETRWPPDVPDCRVLGRADNRRQRREILQALELLEPRPEKVVALCSLARSPDRGILAWLVELTDFAPVEIRMTDAQRLPDLGIDPDARLEDWFESTGRHGLPRPVVLESPPAGRAGPPT